MNPGVRKLSEGGKDISKSLHKGGSTTLAGGEIQEVQEREGNAGRLN